MMYVARDLPPWVRFRDRPKPLPVYTVPTKEEYWFRAIESQSVDILIPRLAAAMPEYNALFGVLGRCGG
jgi:hypothetical protein